MADFDFAAQPPQREQEDVAFAPSEPRGKERQGGFKTGLEALHSDERLQKNGVDPHQGLLSMATLIGMARQVMPHVDAVDGPTGLMSLLRTQVSGQHPTTDDQRYSLDLNKNSVAGGSIAGTKTPLGTAGGLPQDRARIDANSQAMSAIGNLTGAIGGGMASTLSEAGDLIKHQMNWLNQGVKELYKIRRK